MRAAPGKKTYPWQGQYFSIVQKDAKREENGTGHKAASDNHGLHEAKQK